MRDLRKNLADAKAIKAWMEKRESTKTPSSHIKANDEERRLGYALNNIREYLIKPYLELEKEEDRKKYRVAHQGFDEILSIIYAVRMQGIRTSKNELTNLIRQDLEARGLLEKTVVDNSNAEGNAVQEVSEDSTIDAQKYNESSYLTDAKAIRTWMAERKTEDAPNQFSADFEERKLGKALKDIKRYLIAPYMKLQTEEEREKFREENPETDEILSIVSEILTSSKIKSQRKLVDLIKQDLEKRRILEEARSLEKIYEKMAEGQRSGSNIGVNFDEH